MLRYIYMKGVKCNSGGHIAAASRIVLGIVLITLLLVIKA